MEVHAWSKSINYWIESFVKNESNYNWSSSVFLMNTHRSFETLTLDRDHFLWNTRCSDCCCLLQHERFKFDSLIFILKNQFFIIENVWKSNYPNTSTTFYENEMRNVKPFEENQFCLSQKSRVNLKISFEQTWSMLIDMMNNRKNQLKIDDCVAGTRLKIRFHRCNRREFRRISIIQRHQLFKK